MCLFKISATAIPFGLPMVLGSALVMLRFWNIIRWVYAEALDPLREQRFESEAFSVLCYI